ncbi:PAS domain-containing sensor histidine kinase [Rhodospira trueperi]|uniref:histidine kinase n=1 Tax=Rhodospira trueperi TaxID=69960 RepID=A0A1G7F353_9PROT|nr:PAS domain-containing sensor histidine kinase [Rhodospira trueperi]SDE70363.1 PAS domain S-box-containing protein [Rhodospira trueperi]
MTSDREAETASGASVKPDATTLGPASCPSVEALREQVDLLATVQDLTGLGIFGYDMIRETWTVSPNFLERLGVEDTGPLTPARLMEIVHPDDHEQFAVALKAHLGGRSFVNEHREIHQKTGEVVYVRAYARVLHDDNGRARALVGAVQDITDQKKADLALRASEARFRGLFEAMPDYLAVWRRDGDDYVLEDVNPANERLSGGHVQEHLGRRLSDFYADRPDLVDLIHRCGRDGTVLAHNGLYRMRASGKERHVSFKFTSASPDIVLAIAEDIGDRVDAETRLRETADLLLNAEELAGIGSWEWDVTSDVWTFSDNWCRLHGVDEPPRTTGDLLPLAHPDDMARVEAAFERTLSGGPYDITHRTIDQTTGAIRTIKVRGTPILDDAGRVVKVRGVALDITDREKHEHILRETTELMVAGQRLGRMCSFEYDMETERWSLSDTWRELSGTEVRPTTTDELLEWIHPDDRDRVHTEFVAMLRGDAEQMEHRVIHYQTGETLHLRAYGHLVHDDRGRPTRLRGLVQDVTREKRRERDLADSLVRLKMAQQIAGIGSATIDPAVERSDWSEEMYRIYERDPALGPSRLGDHAKLFTNEDYQTFREAVGAAVADAEPFDLTVPLHMSDGRVKWIHLLGRPMPDRGPAGHVVHATVQDITKRKREDEFREDIERIIRHDMRSPISATISGINILRLSDALSDDNRTVLDMMERAAQRQLSLLDASMTLHRVEAGTFRFEPTAVDLGAVFGEVHEELEHLAAAKLAGLRLTMEKPVAALGDAWLCRTLLSNLVRNAVEALPEKRQAVDVRVTTDGDEAVIRVTNPGAVPEDIRDRFFDKYATSGKSGGTGLGTYSACMMARAQKGRVALDTDVPGQTTVTVWLPLAAGERV